MNSKAQIVATIGPAMKDKKLVKDMILAGMDIARLNFSWGTHEEHAVYIKNTRKAAAELGRNIKIVQDLSGPREQKENGHEIKKDVEDIITEKDLTDLKFGLEQGVDYVAMSYVGDVNDVLKLRDQMNEFGKVVPIIAKIERKVALDNFEEIVRSADAVMIARGDLGNEIPLEQIPFIEKDIIEKCKMHAKPVIVATEMMLSMTENDRPTRAETTDVAYAIVNGADAVMLSEETATGKYPVETIKMMERILVESEKQVVGIKFNSL